MKLLRSSSASRGFWDEKIIGAYPFALVNSGWILAEVVAGPPDPAWRAEGVTMQLWRAKGVAMQL